MTLHDVLIQPMMQCARQGRPDAFRLPLPRAPCRAPPISPPARPGVRGCAMSDDASDPARYFGREVRRARLAAGLTLVEFGRLAGYHHAQVSRIERGVRPATLKFAQMCDKVFPDRGGWFEDFYRQSRNWPATPP